MRVGERDGFGRFGVLDDSPDGLLCHECGRRFAHLGLHVFKAHEMTAAEYRAAHGLGRRGLVAQGTREAIAANARASLLRKPLFLQRRDPRKATQARLDAGSPFSPAGVEALRQASARRRGSSRSGRVVTCRWCGLEFCPLTRPGRRRFCSRSCASRYTRNGGPAPKPVFIVRLIPRPRRWAASGH